MEKLSTFVDLLKTNLIIEYNKNELLKNKIKPYGEIYNIVCVGDRIINRYLDKIHYFSSSDTSLPQYYGGIKRTTFPLPPKVMSSLPSLYSFGLRNFILNCFSKLKWIFFNEKTSLKFYTEDYLLPNFYNKQSFTEEGFEKLKLFQLDYPENSLKEIRKIEYLGDNEFVFEVDCGQLLMVKIKVIEDGGYKIDGMWYNSLN